MNGRAIGGAGPAERIARYARGAGRRVAAAESVTAGAVAQQLAAAPDAGEWFVGSVVAYRAEVKFSVLGVDPGPVISARAAGQMARGAARLLGAEIAVGVTGAGGPGVTEGRSPGTVFIAVVDCHGEQVREYRFDGEPVEVVRCASAQALHDLADACERRQDGTQG
jgi:nicotinamide-nucleotide amidase